MVPLWMVHPHGLGNLELQSRRLILCSPFLSHPRNSPPVCSFCIFSQKSKHSIWSSWHLWILFISHGSSVSLAPLISRGDLKDHTCPTNITFFPPNLFHIFFQSFPLPSNIVRVMSSESTIQEWPDALASYFPSAHFPARNVHPTI